MALSPEDIADVKVQLREQVAHLPDQQKARALQQIEQLSPEAVEKLVEQQQEKNAPKKSIFRLIADRDISAELIEETSAGLAVLDINPVAPGHTLIIPKKVITKATKLPSALFQLGKRIGQRIQTKLQASSIELATQEAFDEAIIHVIPSYDKKLSLVSPRQKTTPAELEKVCRAIRKVTKKKIEKIKLTKIVTSLSPQDSIRKRLRIP